MKRGIPIFVNTTVILLTIWMTAQTQPMPIKLPDDSRNFKTIANLVYFITTNGTLYRTDGTSQGTLLLKSGGNPNPSLFTAYRGRAIWFEGGSLWSSDGTASGTIPLTSSNLAHVRLLDSTSNYLFFTASTAATGREIFRTDGTRAGTGLVKDVNPGSAHGHIGSYEILNNELFFGGNDGVHGKELWKTDGTAAKTVLVQDVNLGIGDGFEGNMGRVGSEIFFGGNDGLHGTELWKTDGTSSGTLMVKDINPGADHGFGAVHHVTGNHFFFRNFGSSEPELWVSDGTQSGTIFLKEGDFRTMTNTNGKTFFGRTVEVSQESNQIEIWKSEGTLTSTTKIGNLCIDCRFASYRFLTYNDNLYFQAEDPGGMTQYVWKTDGTEAGTEAIFSSFLDGPIPFFDIVNGFLYFYTTSQGNNLLLEIFDAAEATPTTSRAFKHSVANGAQILMAAVGDFVFFRDHDGPSDEGSALNPEDAFHLFQSNGVNIKSLRDIFGSSYQYTSEIIDFNGKALFSTGNDPKKWWMYDPSSWGKMGRIEQEIWTGIPGKQVSAVPVNSSPSSVSDLLIFETPADIGDNYGSRVRGYVISSQTGDHTFWISSDNRSQLFLSTDANPANKVKIAEVTKWTEPREWNKYPFQQSLTRALVAGQKYYIEALLKEATGSDHLAVGWRLPNGTLERPIPGKRLMIFNASPKVLITDPEEGAVFKAPANITTNAYASDSDGSIFKVEFYNATIKLGEDTSSPYSFIWNDVSRGSYELIAIAVDNDGGIHADTVRITVADSSACAGAGMIRQEFWTAVRSTTVSRIPVFREPDFVQNLTTFEGLVGNNYGSRIRGYICPPFSGDYIFWLSGDRGAELFLSTNDDPANKKRIVHHTRSTSKRASPRQWIKYSTQQSAPIGLVSGQQYYIEALYKQDEGGNNMAVGWQLPDRTMERPIPGNRLSPFKEGASLMSADPTAKEEVYFGIYPNPLQTDDLKLTISSYERIEKAGETHVEIMNVTGTIVFSETIQCREGCSSYLVKLKKKLMPGVYLVSMKANDKRYLKRLLVN